MVMHGRVVQDSKEGTPAFDRKKSSQMKRRIEVETP